MEISKELSKDPLGLRPNHLCSGVAENARNGTWYTDCFIKFCFEIVGKIWYSCLGFRGRGSRHRTVVSPTRLEPDMRARKPPP